MDEFRGTIDGGAGFPRWEEGGGVRFAHARRTVERPDDHEWLDYKGMMTRLFVRHVNRSSGSYTSHVVCDHVGDELRVASALKIHHALQPGIQNQKPLDMLAAFATVLQMPPILLLGETFRFLAMQTLRVKNAGVTEIGIGTQPGELETISRWQMSGDGTQMHVSYGWAMNFTTYRAYLARHG